MTNNYFAIKTKNGKYASIDYDEFFTIINESDTFIGNIPITVFEDREEASNEMIRILTNDELSYFDEGVYLDQVVEISVLEEINEV